METHSNEVATEKVNDIIKYLYDSCNGYQESGNQVEDLTIKQWCQDLSQQRQEWIKVLKDWVRKTGGNPTDSGSFLGAIHRAYVDLKSLVTGGGKEAIINEIKRGENVLINQYEEALKEDLPLDIKNILLNQLTEIRSKLAVISNLA